jgi:hypothetical protein
MGAMEKQMHWVLLIMHKRTLEQVLTPDFGCRARGWVFHPEPPMKPRQNQWQQSCERL